MSTHEALDLIAHLRLEDRPAFRPGRWMWELIDARDGTPFETQFEFEFASDARRSGLARLVELTRSLSGAKMIAKTVDSHRFVMVGREHDALFEELQRLFVDSRTIDVVRDRRCSARRRLDRRTAHGARSPVRRLERRKIDRRICDRRSIDVDASVKARGWWVVPRPQGTTLAVAR
jgi:hypothetical protein